MTEEHVTVSRWEEVFESFVNKEDEVWAFTEEDHSVISADFGEEEGGIENIFYIAHVSALAEEALHIEIVFGDLIPKESDLPKLRALFANIQRGTSFFGNFTADTEEVILQYTWYIPFAFSAVILEKEINYLLSYFMTDICERYRDVFSRVLDGTLLLEQASLLLDDTKMGNA